MDRLRAAALFVVSHVVLAGCSGASHAPVRVRSSAPGPDAAATVPDPNAERYVWEPATYSPQPLGDAPDGPCGLGDRALLRAAERVAAREAAGRRPLDTAEISFALRSGGGPYVWPRAWTLAGDLDERTELAKIDEWLAALGDEGERRCAVASSVQAGRTVFAAVAVSVLADLEPLPTSVRVGTWLDLRGTLLVPATHAEVVVLGPRGRPHAVLASHSGRNVRARFRADREGTWLAQLVVTTEDGPRVAAEAIVAAGVAPPETFEATPAPGEANVPPGSPPHDALVAMVNGARAAEGLPSVRRDDRLDQLARVQAEIMRERKALSHGASDSGMSERLSGIDLHAAGENGAHATDLLRAHRALWRSPSHRENLLHPGYELVGIGIAPDEDGSVWLCQIFADPN